MDYYKLMAGLINWGNSPMYQGWRLHHFRDKGNIERYWASKAYESIPKGYIATYLHLDRLLKRIDEIQG